MSIATKLQTIAENEQKVYDKGYEQGSALKDKKPYINSGLIKYFYQFFSASVGNPIELYETTDFSSGVNFQNCFHNQKGITEIELNAPNCTSLMQVFYGCSALTKVTLGSNSKNTTIAGIFNNCSKLVEVIGAFDMTNVTVTGNAFTSCRELVTVSFVEGSIAFNLSFAYSSKLSLASAKSILLGLKNFTGTDKELAYTITLHADTWTLLDTDNTAPNGLAWAEYVDSIGWNT